MHLKNYLRGYLMHSGKLPIKTKLFDPQVFVFHKKIIHYHQQIHKMRNSKIKNKKCKHFEGLFSSVGNVSLLCYTQLPCCDRERHQALQQQWWRCPCDGGRRVFSQEPAVSFYTDFVSMPRLARKASYRKVKQFVFMSILSLLCSLHQLHSPSSLSAIANINQCP